MSSFSQNIDQCFFSKRDTSLFLQEGVVNELDKKSKTINSFAAKHKVTVATFNAAKNIDIEDILQSLYYEVETLIGFDVSANLEKYCDEKKLYVLVELLKDCAIVIYMKKPVSKELLVLLQRVSLTLKRYTRVRLRLIIIFNFKMLEHCMGAGLRLEYVKLYFMNVPDRKILETRHAIDVELKLERRGVDRFLGDSIERVKLRPRVKSFLGK